ncbi:MAG: ABC transporter ATP-binding protein, partial [Nocardioidaceae bacterium]
MSDARPGGTLKPTERIQAGGGPGRGGPMGGGMVGQRSLTFGPSARRLAARMRPERARVAAVLVLAVLSVGLTVVGPRLLGRATDLVFAGYFGRQFPEGTTRQQAVEQARSQSSGLGDVL